MLPDGILATGHSIATSVPFEFVPRWETALLTFFSPQRFNEAAEKVKTLTQRPSNDELLELYALFKQGSVGDNSSGKG